MKLNTVKTFLLACLAVGPLVPMTSIAGKATMSMESDLATVKKEIEGGADINGKYRCSPEMGCITYLSRAVFRGETEAIQYLLKKGAQVNAIGMFDMPPIATAAMVGQPGIVQMLLDAGADLNLVFAVRGEKYTAGEAALMGAKKEGGQATDPAVKERYEKTIKLLEKDAGVGKGGQEKSSGHVSLAEIVKKFEAAGIKPKQVIDNTNNWSADWRKENGLVQEMLFEHDRDACRLLQFETEKAAKRISESYDIAPGNKPNMVQVNGKLVLSFWWGSKDSAYKPNQKMIEIFNK